MSWYENVEPNSVLKFFDEISKIPRGSGNTRKISDYLVSFATERTLEYIRDEYNNVIIKKYASAGMENHAPVIIQGHTDMVCEKDSGCTKDMSSEGLDLVLDGDTLYAKGTTLGADDGIAIAMMLAILDSDEIAHPLIEAVMTVDEETGMTGATMLDVSPLKGTRMINIDSEDEGIFTVGCAGGNVTTCSVDLKRTKKHGKCFKIEVSGLTGGHSGCEINRGRANANKILGRVLYDMSRCTPIAVSCVSGGGKDNAITVYSCAVICADDEDEVRKSLGEMSEKIKSEFSDTDPNMKIEICDSDCAFAYDDASTEKIIYMLMSLPNGIFSMSRKIEGLVQTSLNMGIVNIENDTMKVSFCIRSSVESEKQQLRAVLECMMKSAGGRIEIFGDYPGWDYRPQSELRNIMTEVFEKQYGRKPKTEAIHAGLECGIIAHKKAGLDCVSIGPDITDIHTPREKLHISSLQRTWRFLMGVLERL